MKHLSFSFLFIGLIISMNINAQQNHFVYIQTVNKQAFYLKFENQVFSSSLAGYLIVPKLKVGVYTFLIGFPKNESPEQTFRCAVEDKDYGYILKPFEENRWGFFNLQSLNVVMADKVEKTQVPVVAEFKSDDFSNMLSTVVNDPAIKQIDPVNNSNQPSIENVDLSNKMLNNKTVIDKTESIKDSASIVPIQKEVGINKTGISNDSSLIISAPIAAVPIVTANLKVDLPVDTVYAITKKKIKKINQGIELVYVEILNGIKDTIQIFIPNDKVNKEKIIEKQDSVFKAIVTTEQSSVKPVNNDVKKETKFLSLDLPVVSTVDLPENTVTAIEKSGATKIIINSDCKNLATDEDFLKLRKKMAGENHADNMILAAKKTFKVKCFTTEQVKNLSVLFLKDMDKYNFFDTAYPYVQDAQNYQTLQNQLSETYYIDRFNVMIRH